MIEFREQDCAMDPHAVQSWIKFCVHLVELSGEVKNKVLHIFLRQHVEESPEQCEVHSRSFTEQIWYAKIGTVGSASYFEAQGGRSKWTRTNHDFEEGLYSH